MHHHHIPSIEQLIKFHQGSSGKKIIPILNTIGFLNQDSLHVVQIHKDSSFDTSFDIGDGGNNNDNKQTTEKPEAEEPSGDDPNYLCVSKSCVRFKEKGGG